MITMKKIQKHIGSVLMAVTMLIAMPALLLTSCSDDDLVKTPLPGTSITEGAKTVSTLNFTWQPVEGAPPYYYLKASDYTLCVYIASGHSGVECTASNGDIWYFVYLYDKEGNNLGCDYDEITW